MRDRVRQKKNGSVIIKNRVYLTTDHLNTPRIGTDEANVPVWRWDSDAFGKGGVDKDPDGDGIKRDVRLRFPGQIADWESGLYYNWNRYYDPGTGRYITSDPIGLWGGLNTYAYVNNNPLRWIDPEGLAPVSCDGTWVYQGMNPSLPRILRRCICYWLCVPCEGTVAWSGVKESLPNTTTGQLYYGGTGGELKSGNSCACAKPGPEKDCKTRPPKTK